MDSIGMSCIKYLLFLFNLFFAISGIGIITIGLMSQQMYTSYSAFIDEKLISAPVILIVIGILIAVIAFFGCCGAIKESNLMLLTFAVLICLIFLLEAAGGVAGYILKDNLNVMIETKMNSSLSSYNQRYYKKTWDALQFDLSCCGVQGLKDWRALFPNGSLPHSCCPNLALDETCLPELAAQQGCLPALTLVLENNLSVLVGLGISVAAIQFLGVIFACCLSRSIRKYETV